MRKYNQIIKKMEKKQLTLKQLKINMNDIVFLRNAGYIIKDQYDPRVGDYVYYIIRNGDMAYVKISEGIKKDEEVKLKLLEISDIHCGCKNFDKAGLDKTLNEAKKRNVEYVHISGDLIDGYGVYKGQENNLKNNRAIEQIEDLMSVLEKYDFWYIASTGNHDQSFCLRGRS